MLRTLAVLALLLAAGTGTAAAQEAWPARPPRLVVPFPPGSISDAIARTVADRIAGSLGQRLVIDNRSGAMAETW
jgi:tripartite-type tricarboxylate transporter receptor subunit TctC